MKIVQFTAENFKRLKVVSIRPDGALVQITGANGQGKSSVLDAIFAALAGTKAAPSQPVRQGEEKAYIRLDLGDIVVTRKFTAAGGTSITVEAQTGAKFPSPQKMLDDLLGALTFDPLEFSRMPAKSQLETLKGMVFLEENVDELDQKNAGDYEARTVLNRELKALEISLQAFPAFPPDLPASPVDVKQTITNFEAAGAHNATGERIAENLRAKQSVFSRYTSQALQKRAQAASLLTEAEELETTASRELEVAKLAASQFVKVDTEPLSREITQASTINRLLEKKQSYDNGLKRRRDLVTHIEGMTGNIERRTKRKQEVIAAAEMPVAGLSFGEGEILFNGVPFAQVNSAEQLKVSVAIAMSANPTLRILRIKDGEKLDSKGLAALEQMAITGDFQIWIERVDESGTVGVVMEDGQAVLGGEDAVSGHSITKIPDSPTTRHAVALRHEEIVSKLTDTVFDSLFSTPAGEVSALDVVTAPHAPQSAEDLMELARQRQRDLRTKKND